MFSFKSIKQKFKLKSLIALSALVISPFSSAEVAVVKMMDFYCTDSFKTGAIDPIIQNELKKLGGKFVFVPIAGNELYISKDRVYYAIKNLYEDEHPQLIDQVRQKLASASVNFELKPADPTQLIEFLRGELGNEIINWNSVRNNMHSAEVDSSMKKAYALARDSNTSTFPTYLILSNGKIVANIPWEVGTSTDVLLDQIKQSIASEANTEAGEFDEVWFPALKNSKKFEINIE